MTRVSDRIQEWRKTHPIVDYSTMPTDLDLNPKIGAFKRQCVSLGAETAFMLWHLSGDLSDDVLLDAMKDEGYRL
jgi:hypothetical protein